MAIYRQVWTTTDTNKSNIDSRGPSPKILTNLDEFGQIYTALDK